MTNTKSLMIMIPALNPDEKLLKLLQAIQLHSDYQGEIIIVNDGSINSHEPIFAEAEKLAGIILLKHEVNQGKGAAIKTALMYLIKHRPDIEGIITVDCDGQHQISDINNCINRWHKLPKAFVFGCREFSHDIPWRSKFGNLLTRSLLRLATGTWLSDTQTGLRIIPKRAFKDLTQLPGTRFEYEMHMIYYAIYQNFSIFEEPIATIYIDNNNFTHFKVLQDSYRIVKSLGAFFLCDILCLVINFFLFSLLLGTNFSAFLVNLFTIGLAYSLNIFIKQNQITPYGIPRTLKQLFYFILFFLFTGTTLLYFWFNLSPSSILLAKFKTDLCLLSLNWLLPFKFRYY